MFSPIDDVFLQLQLNKSQSSVRSYLQIKNNYNFQPYEMIWRRKLLMPATFLIFMINVSCGQTFTCHPAEYQIDDRCCPACPPGCRVETDCFKDRNTSCLPCPDGTFMHKPTGRRQCYTCTPLNCDAGLGLKENTSCKPTSDTVCEPQDGFYCTDRRGNNCIEAQKHRTCHPGQYIKQTGTAFTDTVCSECSAGTFSDGTFTSCRLHTQCESNHQLIKPGTVSTDAECGEESSNVALAVTIVCVVLLLISAGLVYWFYFRKKGTCSRPEKNRTPSPPSLENGREQPEETPLRLL